MTPSEEAGVWYTEIAERERKHGEFPGVSGLKRNTTRYPHPVDCGVEAEFSVLTELSREISNRNAPALRFWHPGSRYHWLFALSLTLFIMAASAVLTLIVLGLV